MIIPAGLYPAPLVLRKIAAPTPIMPNPNVCLDPLVIPSAIPVCVAVVNPSNLNDGVGGA